MVLSRGIPPVFAAASIQYTITTTEEEKTVILAPIPTTRWTSKGPPVSRRQSYYCKTLRVVTQSCGENLLIMKVPPIRSGGARRGKCGGITGASNFDTACRLIEQVVLVPKRLIACMCICANKSTK